jgi:hypothetical protein
MHAVDSGGHLRRAVTVRVLLLLLLLHCHCLARMAPAAAVMTLVMPGDCMDIIQHLLQRDEHHLCLFCMQCVLVACVLACAAHVVYQVALLIGGMLRRSPLIMQPKACSSPACGIA